jgi:hypothetical protein
MPRRHQGYYPNRPGRELVLEEIKNAAGELLAVVTRNSYGCRVLNTARVMFVDVDLAARRPASRSGRGATNPHPLGHRDGPGVVRQR